MRSLWPTRPHALGPDLGPDRDAEIGLAVAPQSNGWSATPPPLREMPRGALPTAHLGGRPGHPIGRPAAARMALILLIVRPAVTVDCYHLDRFTAVLDGEVIVTSRQPLLEGARVLLRRGYDPDTRLTIRHAGSDRRGEKGLTASGRVRQPRRCAGRWPRPRGAGRRSVDRQGACLRRQLNIQIGDVRNGSSQGGNEMKRQVIAIMCSAMFAAWHDEFSRGLSSFYAGLLGIVLAKTQNLSTRP